jgi:hypothetical protein
VKPEAYRSSIFEAEIVNDDVGILSKGAGGRLAVCLDISDDLEADDCRRLSKWLESAARYLESKGER